jgi:hypothetical protein
MRTLIDRNEYATLWYHPGLKIVHHKIHKFIPAGIFQDILTTGAKIIEEHKATKWLSDDRQNTVVRNDDLAWASAVWAPRVVRAGLKYWAIVPPEKVIGQMQMDGIMTEYAALGLTILTFADETAALEWLSSLGGETRP